MLIITSLSFFVFLVLMNKRQWAGFELLTYAICGSLCTTNDDLVRSVEMRGLATGDVLAFTNIGAYSVTEGIYLFLSRTMPRIVLYNKNSGPRLVRDFTETSPLNTIHS